jgi:hypothetical protein
MNTIIELKNVWINKSSTKEDFYFWSARYLSGKYGEDYQKAAREIGEMIVELQLTRIQSNKIWAKAKAMHSR